MNGEIYESTDSWFVRNGRNLFIVLLGLFIGGCLGVMLL